MSGATVLDLAWFNVLKEADRPDGPNRSLQPIARLDQRLRDAAFRQVMEEMQTSGLAELALFAEHLVVHESFVVDRLALNATLAEIPNVLIPFIQVRTPQTRVYQSAAKAVQNLTKKLWTSSEESAALTQLLNEMSSEGCTAFWSGQDKNLHDYMERSGTALQMVASANSTGDDMLSRVLFYLEFGRSLGDEPLLGPGKRRWLEIIGQSLRTSIHDLIANRFDSAVLAKILSQLPHAFEDSLLRCPPVAELVLKKAIAEGLTVIESAIQIRGSPEATDYRGLLTELKQLLKQGRSGRLAAQRAITGLDKLSAEWAAHSDVGLGVTHQYRKWKFSKVPYIGDLLEAGGMSEMQIKDRILSAPPGYLAFISSWYRPQGGDLIQRVPTA